MTSKERVEARRKGKRVFRIRHVKTGAWWEGIATTPKTALITAAQEMSAASIDMLNIREYTSGGGWKKC